MKKVLLLLIALITVHIVKAQFDKADVLDFANYVEMLPKMEDGNVGDADVNIVTLLGKEKVVKYRNATWANRGRKTLAIVPSNYGNGETGGGFIELDLENVGKMKVFWEGVQPIVYINNVVKYFYGNVFDVNQTGPVNIKICNNHILDSYLIFLHFVMWTDCVTTDVDDNLSPSFQCYPNPLQDVLNFKGVGAVGSVNIYGTDGVLVKTVSGVKNNNISCAGFLKGIYIVQVTTITGDIYTQKIIKK